MILLKVLILILTFNPHDMKRLTCSRGERVTRNGNGCEECPKEYYQDHDNISKSCKPCDTCGSGSAVEEDCTRVKNRKCKCKENFTPWDDDHSTCKCDKGYGLNTDRGKCEKCQEGFFTSTYDTHCKKWKECKSGVNISGTVTSDAVCNEPSSNSYITTLPTSNKVTSLRSLTTQRPHGGAHTLDKRTTSAATPRATTSIKNSTPSVYTGNHIGMALIIFGIVGLLVLTVVTCKLHITDCRHDQKPDKRYSVTVDSFRKPVEESCEGNPFLLKSNLVEA